MFVTSIEIFLRYVPAVSHTKLDLLQEPLQRAYENFLVPNFSEELCKDLQDKYLTNALSPEEQVVVSYFQRIEAYAANYYHLPINDVRQKPNGIVRVISETEDTAYPRQVAALRQTYWENTHECLEKALDYVYKHLSNFPLFQSSEAFTFQQGLLLQNAQLFCHAIAIPTNRLIFNKVQYLIAEVEEILVPSLTGIPLYEQLLAEQHAQSLSTPNKLLIKQLQKVIAYEVWSQALKRLPIAIDENGVYRIEQTYQTAYSENKVANEHRIGITYEYYKEIAALYKKEVTSFLEKNAANYPLLPVTPPDLTPPFELNTEADKSFIF
jgi:hypothetical protein